MSRATTAGQNDPTTPTPTIAAAATPADHSMSVGRLPQKRVKTSTMLLPARVAVSSDVRITWSQAEPAAAGRSLMQMAAENATETLQALRTQWQADSHKQEQALTELQEALRALVERFDAPTLVGDHQTAVHQMIGPDELVVQFTPR